MASYKVENIESVDELLDNKTNEDVGVEPMIFAPDEPRVTINERILDIPDELKTIGVENDNNVERIYFEIPRYFDEVNDLSEFNFYINYLNANQEPNKYHCTDVEVEGENIVFSWLTSQDVYKYRGTVRFIVYAVASDNRKWNSTIAELFVMEGLETEEQIIDNNPDIIDELINLKPQVEEALQRIDEQQNVINQQQDTIEEQQSTITEQQKDIEDTINNLNTKIENGDFTPEFTIGDVETVEPSVPAEVNQTGTQLDPILNFKIPRGATNVVDNLDGTSVAEAPSQRVVKEAVDNINTEIDQIKDTGVQVADTLPIGSVIGWDSEEDYPTDIYEEVDYNPKQLLINPDFQINQRGQSEYQGNQNWQYTLDMWRINSYAKVIVNDGYIRIKNNDDYSGESYFNQKIDLKGTKTLVVKIIDFDGEVKMKLEGEQQEEKTISDVGIHYLTSDIDISSVTVQISGKQGAYVEIEYINLFEGDIAYPHVKNKYAYDLMECQHKIFVITNITGMVNGSANNLYTAIQQNLDSNPNVIVIDGEVYIDGFFNSSVTEIISQNWVKNGSIELVIKFENKTDNGKVGRFTDGKIILSCEPL